MSLLAGRASGNPETPVPKAAVNVADIVLIHAVAETRCLIQKAGHWIGATAVTIGCEGGRWRVLASTSSQRQKQAGGSIDMTLINWSKARSLDQLVMMVEEAAAIVLGNGGEDREDRLLQAAEGIVALALHGPLQN